MMMDKNLYNIKIAEILTKRYSLNREISVEESEILSNWLNESEDNYFILEKYKSGELLAEFEKVVSFSDLDKSWENIEHTINPRKSLSWKKLSYAASILILLSIGIVGYFYEVRNMERKGIIEYTSLEPGVKMATLVLDGGEEIELGIHNMLIQTNSGEVNVNTGTLEYNINKEDVKVEERNTIIVPRGGIYSIILDDGTKVFLNSESELNYPVVFTGDTREVFLKGEGFFEVAPDSERPFFVYTGDVHTKVLGTTFNVMAYDDEPYYTTTLISGKVEVSVDGTEINQILTPGLQSRWSGENEYFEVKEVNVSVQSLWRDGIIMLYDDDIESVMRMLSRWYNIDYVFENDRSVKHTFTGKIDRNENLGTVLDVLTLLGGPRFEIKDRKVFVY